MKKYILKDGKEVKFGDTIHAKTNFNGFHSVVIAVLDEYTVDMLKGLGIIKEIEVSDTPIADKVINDAFKEEAKIKQKELETAIKEHYFHILKEDNIPCEYDIKEHHLELVEEYVARKLGVNIYEAVKYLEDLENISPTSVLNIYLKRISLKLDKKYPHIPIRSLDKIYIISMYDGKVTSVCPKDIKNLKHFAWFRSIGDAIFARSCVIGLIEKMFGKDDQSEDK